MTRTVKIMSGPNYRTDRTHPFRGVLVSGAVLMIDCYTELYFGSSGLASKLKKIYPHNKSVTWFVFYLKGGKIFFVFNFSRFGVLQTEKDRQIRLCD